VGGAATDLNVGTVGDEDALAELHDQRNQPCIWDLGRYSDRFVCIPWENPPMKLISTLPAAGVALNGPRRPSSRTSKAALTSAVNLRSGSVTP